ncbi:proteoglycan 4-like [Telopea speciosissima]|uniref:proteoglycan 4-like n=1 Tax=Telopea speciosissima TaxID=54955 RepID=UPI001CC7DBC9|nr:proteoglycan 4-like [Telopea speciosissima]
MAERTSRRRSFRFPMPRLMNPAPTITRRPTESQPPTTQAAEIPIQGSLFQRRGRSRSQPHTPPNTPELRPPPSPSSFAKFLPFCKVPPSPQSQKTFQPPSPSRISQPQPAAQTASSPPSPPSKDVPSPSHTASQPPSPSHTAPQQTLRTIPLSPSPSRIAPVEQPKAQAASQPSSPTQQAPISLPTTQANSHPSMPSQKASQPPSPLTLSSAQDEPVLPQPPSQKPPPLVETSSKPASTSQIKNQIRATTKSNEAVKYPSQALDQVVAGTSSSREVRETPFLQQTSPKAEETKAEQKTSLEPKRAEKPKPSADEEPKQRTITELISVASGLRTKTKGQPNITPQDGKKKLEKQAALEGKQTTETGSKDRESKVVTAYPKERSMGSESRPESTIFLGDQGILQREIRDDISKLVNKLAMGDPKQAIDGNQATVITLAGENRGAVMHVGTESAKGEGSVHIHRGYKLNQYDNAETTTDEEGSSQRRMENPKTGEDTTTSAYINSNVQSINNSIILSSSCSERNPGVHLIFSHNTKDKSESTEITPAQKLTHEPIVRRRCLRALFLESSDTDPNNLEKPRRHGCRYSCEKKQDKDKQTEV